MKDFENMSRKELEELSKEDIWEFLVNYGIATENELQLVTCVNGYNIKALIDVLEVRTAYHSVEQYIACEIYNDSNYFENEE